LGSDAVIESGIYYTHIDHILVVDKGTLNGKDSVLYDGNMEQVYTTQNKGQAFITGFYADAKFKVNSNWMLCGNFNTTRGRILTGAVETPLDHIAPLSGKVSVDYKKNNWTAAAWMLMNGRKKISDYLLNAEDNEIYATPNGMPAWQCVNLRVGYQLHKHVNLQLACENIFDSNYRVFASGISAPGRNFKITVRGTL
jgi:hemoglobin/transferrin/lactoferrin receptor protein